MTGPELGHDLAPRVGMADLDGAAGRGRELELPAPGADGVEVAGVAARLEPHRHVPRRPGRVQGDPHLSLDCSVVGSGLIATVARVGSRYAPSAASAPPEGRAGRAVPATRSRQAEVTRRRSKATW